MSSLSEMPEVVIKKIFDKLDIRAIFTLRKVSHFLRNFIDDVVPDSKLKVVEVSVCSEYIWIRYTFSDGPLIINTSERSENGGCKIVTRKKKVFDELDYVGVFSGDLGNILKFQKSAIQYFSLGWSDVINGSKGIEPTIDKILEKLEEVLNARKRKLKVKNIRIDALKQNQVLSILPFVDSEHLETIGISNPESPSNEILSIDKIAQLEQWKQGKTIYTPEHIVASSTEYFTHFSKGIVSFLSVSVEGVILLKETFLSSSSFVNFQIKYQRFEEKELLSDVLGSPSNQEENDRTEWIVENLSKNSLLKTILTSSDVYFVRCSN
ncbi:hypothetical protein GCK72_001573 [Caenorhabditis remanei]|uniref:F-box domain-containing protein n=1 Tax=Caenorhabditis remanei TaxID=31234 RepID=A0A6A5HSQ1_CAERE|nr:hypothetical protein GCK72_001573 [Caenorhabditis remanei]KAF1769756.1 hypothetical protein GCK72_001573 [Caenorhabditis remanei]